MKKDWTKKCTCENFQQNEDCEHIGNKVLEELGMQVEDSMGSYHIANTHIEEVGLGVGDKDCPDCLPYDGCAKHYIKNGDRHDRVSLGEPPKPVKICPNCKVEISNGESNWGKHCMRCGKDFCSRCVDSHDCGCALTGALTPLGEKLAEIKKKIIEKATFEPGVSSNGWYQIYKDDLDSIL